MKCDYISNERSADPAKLSAMIRRVELFSGFNQLELVNIGKYLSLKYVSAGSKVFQQGDTGKDMYFVATGRVKVIKETAGNTTQITTVRPGQSLGEMSMLDTLPYSATVLAETNCYLLALSRARYLALLKEDPELGIKVLSQLAKLMSIRLRLTTGVLTSVSFKE